MFQKYGQGGGGKTIFSIIIINDIVDRYLISLKMVEISCTNLRNANEY